MFRFSSTSFLTGTSKYNRIPLYIERDRGVLIERAGKLRVLWWRSKIELDIGTRKRQTYKGVNHIMYSKRE